VTTSNVTIKYSTAKDASWYTAAGTPTEIKGQLIEFFDLREAEDLSPHEVVLLAQGIAQSTNEVATKLGGEPVVDNAWPTPPTEEEKAERKAQRQAQKAANAAATDAPSEPEEKDDRKFGEVLAAIEGAASEQELRQVWVTANTAAKKDPEVLKLFKARGKSLRKA